MKTLIKGGTLVTCDEVRRADILIEGEKIIGVFDAAEADVTGTGDLLCKDGKCQAHPCEDTALHEHPGAEGVHPGVPGEAFRPGGDTAVIDASGKYIFPGAVDIHTHMDLDVGIARVIDDFYTGTVAAACGGTTTIVDHMAFGPKGCALRHQSDEYHRLADGKAAVDYGFHGVFQHVNDAVLDEMPLLAREEGITSFKVYMTYDYMINDFDMMKILARAAEENILIASHCENDGIVRYWRERFVREGKTAARYHPVSRPAEAEAEAVHRFLSLARAAGEAPVYIVHLSSEAGLREVLRAKETGQKHFGVETCTQYLLLGDSMYEDDQEGLKAIMAPPLRKEADRAALWKALSDNVLDTVATDHCPFTFSRQKQQGADDFTKCPSGAPGVEERLTLLYSEGVCKGRITLPQLIKYACTNPARAAGLYPQKGTVSTGSDADLVIFDPDREHVLSIDRMHGAGDYTCYEGMRVRGSVEQVFLRGRSIVKDGNFTGKRGYGNYLKRGTSMITDDGLPA
ncbi:MAG: dihydropyrimidinase [Blautia sp.]|nr:dihydropyrimidinase [Blautia sp.]